MKHIYLSSCLDSMSLYHSLVWAYGDYEKFDAQSWTTYIEPALTAWVAFVAHVFYIFRCWVVTRSPVICIFLGAGMSSEDYQHLSGMPILLFLVAVVSLVSGITYAYTCPRHFIQRDILLTFLFPFPAPNSISVLGFPLGRMSRFGELLLPATIWFTTVHISHTL
jgi:hypothetical protein